MIRATFATVLVLAVPALGRAQPLPERAERAEDRRELRHDRRELREDFRNLAWIDRIIYDYDAARTSRDRAALARVEDEATGALAREVQDARVELAKSRGEVRRDAYEGRDRRDDRRDLRDDRRDLRRVIAIDEEFQSLRGRMDRRALDRKRSLLVQLRRMAKAEIREDRRELREDRRALRDDRRR
jgi:hypothetical protein